MGKTIKAWAMFIGVLLIPVVAIAAHFIQTSGSHARRAVHTALTGMPPEEQIEPPQRPTYHQALQLSPSVEQPRSQANPVSSQTMLTPDEGAMLAPPKRPRKTEADKEAELETAFQAARAPGIFEKGLDRKLRALFDIRQVNSLECREGRCRMELTFPDAASAELKIEEVFMAPDFDLGVGGTIASRSVASDGTTTVRVYLHRGNDSVPDPGHG